MVSGFVTTLAALLLTFAGHSSPTETNRCAFYGVSIRRCQTLTRPSFLNDLPRRHVPPSVRRSSGRLNPLCDENRMGLISAKGNNKFIFRNSMAYK